MGLTNLKSLALTYEANVSCILDAGKVIAIRDGISDTLDVDRTLDIELSLYDLAALELFAHGYQVKDVFETLHSPTYLKNLEKIQPDVAAKISHLALTESAVLRLFLGKNNLVAQYFSQKNSRNCEYISLTSESESHPSVAVALFSEISGGAIINEWRVLENIESFIVRVNTLVANGFMAPCVNTVDWGDLKRIFPMCQAFGRLRDGTSIDRYYLDSFVSDIRTLVVGEALEIGGSKDNAKQYGFDLPKHYRALDFPGVSDDIEGDATDSNTFTEGRFDCILSFNVLEHCPEPQLIVDNIKRWLKPGGKAIVLVPTAQKIHAAPRDYWRPLPDALEFMFDSFAHSEIKLYGNLMSTIANLMGITAEELSAEELDVVHPDYPVVSCIVATK